jgi:monoamine oxidase
MSKEVLIIGAGACGLMAGKILCEIGYLVTVIESRARTGGRIFSDNNTFSASSEFGAEFIHGDQPVTLALAKEAGVELTRLEGKWYQLRKGKVEESVLFDEQWEDMTKELKALKSDTDIGSFLQKHFSDPRYDELREGVRKFVEGYDAADVNKVSAFALRDEWSESDDAEQHRLRGGYGKIITYLVEKIESKGGKILQSSTVVKLGWTKGNVTVETSEGTIIKGERVIITVPIGILQQNAIEFSPPLPHRKDIFQRIGYGGVIKFLFEFRPDFWENVIRKKYKDFAFILSDAVIPTWWCAPENVPMLTGWWGGPSTIDSDHNPETLYEKAVESLQYIFGCTREDLDQSIVKHQVVDWVSDPYSRGAYAYATVNSQQARSSLTVPIDDTIYFAGEALYSGTAMGTVEAALVSGREVSKKISGLRGAD